MAFQPTLGKFGVPLVPGQTGNGILMPKLKNRFNVLFQNFGPAGNSVDLSRQIATITRPSFQTASTEIHAYNNIMWVAGKSTLQPITITIRDEISNSAMSLIEAQIQKQFNHFDQTSPAAGINYKFTATIQTLDGGDTNILESWFLEGGWITSVEHDTYDYSSSDQTMISLTVQFDNATNSVMPQTVANTGTGVTAG
jgi:hypothetical protein